MANQDNELFSWPILLFGITPICAWLPMRFCDGSPTSTPLETKRNFFPKEKPAQQLSHLLRPGARLAMPVTP